MRNLMRLTLESLKDSWVYAKFSTVAEGLFRDNVLAHRESDIIRIYHVIEKGLSMRDFRPRFGEDMIRRLHALLKEWSGPVDGQIATGWTVLQEYIARHTELGIDVSDLFANPVEVPERVLHRGGVKPYTPARADDRGAFERVVRSRVSVRHFDSTLVPDQKMIEQAVSIAMTAPSVCNRQTCRVHGYPGERGQVLLSLQNGNRGFGHTVPLVLVVTSDLRQFTGASERYQAWVDGGMFSMNLLLGLHALGLGAVPLNWSVMNERDRELHKLARLPEYERVIMMIGCGHPLPDCNVPVSCRRDLKEVLYWDQQQAGEAL